MESPPGPPYPPTTASLGGEPRPIPDDPVCAVLLLLFIGSAATHMTIFQINRRHGHKFIFSGMCFGFSTARIIALTMRIVWAGYPTNVSIAIASSIFTQAGVLVLFVVNLFFSVRIVRAYHPGIGWHRAVDATFKGLLVCIPALLVMVITSVVYSFFTLDAVARQRCRDVQLVATTSLAVLAFLPIPIVSTAAALRPRKGRVDKFGSGRWRTKVRLVLFTATLLSFGAAYRAGVGYVVRPVADPADSMSKAAFYCVTFGIELVVVYTYAVIRFDRRFHIPNGSSGPGDYGSGGGGGIGVTTEEETFGPTSWFNNDSSEESDATTVVAKDPSRDVEKWSMPRLKW